LIKFNIQ